MPWVGGVNTSVDPGVLNEQELVQADNVVFSSTGARIKREALEYLDLDLPVPAFRSSSGTTRTLRFAANELVTTSPDDEKLVVGEHITVTGVANYAVTDAPILSRTDLGGGVYAITYTGGSSLSESNTAAGSITVERASSVIMVKDYWRYNDGGNEQLLVFATNNFQLFKLDGSGRRVQIHGQEQTTTIVCGDAASLTTGDYFLLNSANDATEYYVWYNKASGGGDPALIGKTAIPVAIAGGATAAQVASATQVAVDAVADFVATVDTTTVTVTNAEEGLCRAIEDFNTGFTFTTTFYGATLPTADVERIRTNVFNEKLKIYFSGLGNYPIYYHPETSTKYQLAGENPITGFTAPDASFAFNHLSREWTNDKNDQDLLHYCETFDDSKWLGIGDSGAIYIGFGDGDPKGLINAYVYKGFVVAGKGASRSRILGDSPENFTVEKISDGMGNEGPFSVAVDESDVIFISKRGIHSQQTTDQYGDTDAAYLSADIKPTFNDFDNLDLIQGAYIPELNSVAFSTQDRGDNSPNDVWLYNIENQVPGKQKPGCWYRWPNISCTALTRRIDNNKNKLVFGTSNGRVIQAQKFRNYADFDEDGILYQVKTGTIYPGGDPQSMKAFHKITLFYRPIGSFNFSVAAKIDNNETQSFSFAQASGSDLLGIDFILGASELGASAELAPFTYTMDGHGRGIVLTITQPDRDEQVEVWGMALEWSSLDIQQETT